MIVDSNYEPDALSIQGNGGVSASEIEVTGGYQAQGNGKPSPAPNTKVAPTPDPFAFLPMPDPASLGLKNQKYGGESTTLNPGANRQLIA
jgi:hypothetical protein